MKANKMTWRKTFALNNRAMKLLFSNYPAMILSRLLTAIWTAVAPYATIYLSAMIVTTLTTNQSIKEVMFWVLLTLGVTAFCGLVKKQALVLI